MRKALVVGIDYYQKLSPLYGCVSDAYAVRAVLERHSDGSINFGVKTLAASGEEDAVCRKELKDAIRELFEDDSDTALLYFAGHGFIETTGGYLIPSDSATGDDGVSLSEVLSLANESKARNKVIILDSCHSGYVGKATKSSPSSDLSEGLTILTASTETQYATEELGSGVFTTLLVDALNGSASNLVGDVTPGSIYAHIDQSLGPWEQRPVFKTNVKTFVSLRRVQPPIPLSDLQMITQLFPEPGFVFNLDPSYEPDSDDPDSENTLIFAVLQRYNRVNLVVPIDTPHMYYAAMESKGCRLTVLGEHYRKLVANKRI